MPPDICGDLFLEVMTPVVKKEVGFLCGMLITIIHQASPILLLLEAGLLLQSSNTKERPLFAEQVLTAIGIHDLLKIIRNVEKNE
jgi:hypothetical protein